MVIKCHASVIVHDKDDVERVTAAAQEVVKISKESPGNISIGFFKEVGGENTFAFIEEWESEVALHDDIAGDHVQNFIQEMGDSIKLDVKIFSDNFM